MNIAVDLGRKATKQTNADLSSEAIDNLILVLAFIYIHTLCNCELQVCLNRVISTKTFKCIMYVDVSSGARDLNFGPSLHLHPYFVCVSSKGSGKSV